MLAVARSHYRADSSSLFSSTSFGCADYDHVRPAKLRILAIVVDRIGMPLFLHTNLANLYSQEVVVAPGENSGQSYHPGNKIKPSRVLVLEGKVSRNLTGILAFYIQQCT